MSIPIPSFPKTQARQGRAGQARKASPISSQPRPVGNLRHASGHGDEAASHDSTNEASQSKNATLVRPPLHPFNYARADLERHRPAFLGNLRIQALDAIEKVKQNTTSPEIFRCDIPSQIAYTSNGELGAREAMMLACYCNAVIQQ